jgi:Ca2+-transporting ATPase
MRAPGFANALLAPTNLLLLACALLYALIGEGDEALILLLFVVGISLLDGVQRHRSQRALAELARLSAPRARVRRDGEELELPPERIVPGDELRLEEGDRVAADGVLAGRRAFRVRRSGLRANEAAAGRDSRGLNCPPQHFLWNAMMSIGGGSFVLAASESISVPNTTPPG